MKRLLIGHRGTGKSSLLQRLSIYQNLYSVPGQIYDLDREIEKMAGTSIAEIFALAGESSFRKMEIKALEMLYKQKNFTVALGAGFPLEEFLADRKGDPDLEIIWVRRSSDALGRVFLDRPRLNPSVTPIEESQELYRRRDRVYQSFSNWIYDLPEGQTFPSEAERTLFFGGIEELTGGMTLLKAHARNFESFKSREWRWDIDFFELRDDLLSDEELEKFFVLLEKRQVLISFRKEIPSPLFLSALSEGYRADWPLELAGPAPEGIQIFSVHERKQSERLESVIERLEAAGSNCLGLKLAVEIDSYAELETGLRWQAKNPSKHSFLPRSKDGRWSWVRLWLKDRQQINFFRQGDGSALDQPDLSAWISTPRKPNAFAAVLGHPVRYSYSPTEHREFFLKKEMPFFAIDISESEWTEALQLLQKMGLMAAAVTSPLKKKAFGFCKIPTSTAIEFQSANTIWRSAEAGVQDWHAHNTDLDGFKFLLETLNLEREEFRPIAIWGGGGTLSMLQSLIPDSQSFSSRTGLPRNPGESAVSPATLIWAAPPMSSEPSGEWSPKLVIDLNYRDDSQAKVYGQRMGARYISGLPMFKAQALAQQEIWQAELRKETRDGK